MTVTVHQNETREEKISLTPSAEQHIFHYLSKNQHYIGIRFSIKKTGCSGLSYVVDYVESPKEEDVLQQLNEHYILCIDKKSYPFIKGMKVDYIKDGLNYKFVFENPNQTGQCGCGESFTID